MGNDRGGIPLHAHQDCSYQKKKKNPENTSIGEDVEKLEPLCTAGGNVKWCSCCGKQFGSSSKLNIELPYDPAIPLLDIYSKELKAGTQTDACILIFTGALVTVATRWKQPTCWQSDFELHVWLLWASVSFSVPWQWYDSDDGVVMLIV